MKLGFSIPNNQGVADVSALVDLAVRAQAMGYRSVWVSEHLFHSNYVAKRLGSRPYHDPLTVLTAIACRTQQIRLGTSVLVLPWHHPARLGKTIATLDHLSGGRVDLGVGVAITEDEFDNLGIDFNSRGRRMDDTLVALKALWYQDVPEHTGEFYQFAGQRFEPKPLQSTLPIHIGGGSAAALRRVIQFGQGWHALGKSPQEIGQDIGRLKTQLRSNNRDPESLHISIRCVAEFVESSWHKPVAERRMLKGTSTEISGIIEAFAAAGVDEIVIDANSSDMTLNLDVMAQVMGLVR